ncbi:MAG TPA: transglutaminase family protein [Bryobacteraceae bacterium]|jgi:transglutaminase-like putative cysteine protease
MLIRLGYDISLEVTQPTTIVAVLNVHPSRVADLREADEIQLSPDLTRERYWDSFGNICTRMIAPQGNLRLRGSTLIEDSGEPDAIDWSAPQLAVGRLPTETLQFLLASRYCEVDRLSALAWQLFGTMPMGWPRVQAICDWVHQYITFDYGSARPTKSALDVYAERQGVCRDFQHLAIAFCRAMHIPARYATGYLGDIGVPLVPPMDFSAWFEAYLGDRWWTFDARNNQPRIGRVLMASGRDAADVAITTSFGISRLNSFAVITEEVETVSQHSTMRAELCSVS